jgi:hypothetical protein
MSRLVLLGILVLLFIGGADAGEDVMKRVTIGVAGMMKSQNGVT